MEENDVMITVAAEDVMIEKVLLAAEVTDAEAKATQNHQDVQILVILEVQDLDDLGDKLFC